MSGALFAAIVAIMPAALIGPSAGAHPVHVQQGEIRMRSDGIDVRFSINEHDAAHHRTTAAALANEIAHSLHVFDERGARIAPAGITNDAGTCTIVYALDRAQRYITFQQRVAGESASRGRMLQFCVRRKEVEGSSVLRLSAGGNAETIDRFAESIGEQTVATDRFHDVVLYVERVEAGAKLELHVPAPLLETWLPVKRLNENILCDDELERCAEAIGDWFTSRLKIQTEGTQPAIQIQEIVLLPPGCANASQLLQLGTAEPASDKPARGGCSSRVGYWCARVAILAELQAVNKSNDLRIHCNFFNSRVLKVQVMTRDHDAVHRQTLTTYDPVLSLRAMDSAMDVTEAAVRATTGGNDQ